MSVEQYHDVQNVHEVLEFASAPAALKVDRDAGVIRNVRILGNNSRNGRRYTTEAIHGAVAMYEGRAVNLDHPPKGDPHRVRNVSERFGWLSGVREGNDGLYGDMHYLKAHPQAGAVVEAAERNPQLIGLSHNADIRFKRDKGVEVAYEIIGVRSVDLVSDPATTRSLFESAEPERKEKTVQKKVLEILSAVYADAKHKSILEEMTPMMPDAPVETAETASSDDQVKAAFRQMVVAAFDDEKLDSQATLAKIKEILKAQEKLTAKEEAPNPDAKPDEKSDEKLAKESKEPAPAADATAVMEACSALAAAKVEITPVRLKAYTALSEAADRKALLESWAPTLAVEKPKSKGTPVTESKDATPAPKDAKEFVKRLKSRR